MVNKCSFKVIVIFVAIVAVGIFMNMANASAQNIYLKKQTKITNEKYLSASEKLMLIDKYQDQYFNIIKRNNLFLSTEENRAIKKDRQELKKLFSIVKKQIKNRQYAEKYKSIEKRYSKCNCETTIEMNQFAQKNYNEVDGLLNEVYKGVQSKILPEDFAKLTVSEKKWIKEVENYKKVYDSMNFGTIGTIIYYDYEINMREFRTLLLMLYL